MAIKSKRVAILFPAVAEKLAATRLEESRLAFVGEAFAAAGVDVVGAPFADEIATHVGDLLNGIDVVLVWYNPTEGGHDRSVLNDMLRDVASRGVLVSTHPDIIDGIGTKEVLYRTRGMGWGCDTELYTSVEAMCKQLPAKLRRGPRVLKQIRGQSGDGVWKVEAPTGSTVPQLRVRHAKRGSGELNMSWREFSELCAPYFAATGAMIDQPFQPRLQEGMVRCYLVGNRVEGFGEQLINALYPAPSDAPPLSAPQPGPRLYYPSTRPDFQRLKDKLEREWISDLCRITDMAPSDLPLMWDADFLYGPKDADGADSYVLCEINVSSVYPFPPSALSPLVGETLARIARR